MKTLVILLFTLISPALLAANFKGIEYTIEPIYGYQKIELEKPENYAVWEYFYGARVSGGYKVFSLEGMYSTTKLEKIFVSTGERTTDKVEKLKIGFATSTAFNNWSLGLLRLGAEGKRISHTSSLNPDSTKDTIRPYLGFGLEIYLKQYIALSLGVTAIMRDFPNDLGDNEYEYTSGIKLLY